MDVEQPCDGLIHFSQACSIRRIRGCRCLATVGSPLCDQHLAACLSPGCLPRREIPCHSRWPRVDSVLDIIVEASNNAVIALLLGELQHLLRLLECRAIKALETTGSLIPCQVFEDFLHTQLGFRFPASSGR